MAFLAALGRSGALQQTNQTLLQIAQGMRQQRMQEQELRMKTEAHNIDMAVSRMKMEEIQQKKAADDKIITLEQAFGSVPNIANSPSVQRRLMDLAGDRVVEMNGVQGIRVGDIKEIMAAMQSNLQFQAILDQDLLRDSVARGQGLQQMMQNPKLKPEERQGIQQQLAQIEQLKSDILTRRAAIDEKFAREQLEQQNIQSQIAYREGPQTQASLASAAESRAQAGLAGVRAADIRSGGGEGVKREKGTLTESQAREELNMLGEGDPVKTARLVQQYSRLRSTGKTREQAIDVITQSNAGIAPKPLTGETISSHAPVTGGQSFGYLWGAEN